MPLLASGLLPASFRGAPFAVEADDMGGGRRQAVHVYPGRDTPWAEDMGRAPRTFRFRGFIVDGDVVFAGGPIQLQRLLLIAALEKSGSGTLTHPTLGILNVSVSRFSIGGDQGAGRKSTVEVEFVESGKRSFPSLLSQGSGLLSAANLAKLALVADAVRGAVLIADAIGSGEDARAAGAACVGRAASAGNDATAVLSLAARLPGNNGRYAAGANSGYVGATASPYAGSTAVADLIAVASTQRAVIAAAGAALQTSADGFGPSDAAATLAQSADALVSALLAACADPADAVRLLLDLLAVPPMATGNAGALVVRAFKRSTSTALALACAAYQPRSYDDAFALLARVSNAIDAVATEAADAGDDQSFQALRALRVQVVADLRGRGAVLSPIRTFTTSTSSPALVLGQRFYRDPARGDELVAEAAPIHPLFMPLTIQALAA